MTPASTQLPVAPDLRRHNAVSTLQARREVMLIFSINLLKSAQCWSSLALISYGL
jgi:hypothetical protein